MHTLADVDAFDFGCLFRFPRVRNARFAMPRVFILTVFPCSLYTGWSMAPLLISIG
jgi:hypothetical protein